ncbi:MAG: response regulator, partial [Rubrivivax sp.]|nr:response regulator [Rubrivivax sp.]
MPLRRSSDPEPAPPARAPAVRGSEALLVDDQEIALRYLETRLQPLGLHTQRATTSGKALEMLAQRDYDFVFVDVELGTGSDLDGLALCQHIKRQHLPVAGGHAPVVAMVSAHHSELDRARGMLAGCDAYLGKPLDEAALRQLVSQHGGAAPAFRRS